MEHTVDYLKRAAELWGDAPAADDGSVILSWAQLYRRAAALATALLPKVRRGGPVPVFMEKSCGALVSLYAAPMAGGFAVPLSPRQPALRLAALLETLDAPVVLAAEAGVPALRAAGWEREILVLPENGMEGNGFPAPDFAALAARRSELRGDNLLYGLFTSGSTGVPKCVTVTHRAALTFIKSFVNTFGFTPSDVLANQAPFDFDVSVKDIYTCLLTGAELLILPEGMFASPPRVLDRLVEKKATVLIWAVSALTLLSSLRGLEYRVPETVRMVLFSGEVMPPKQLRLWQEALPAAEFVNLYGPTEVVCNCSFYRVARPYADDEVIPLGTAFPGRRMLLLDEVGREMAPPPPGTASPTGEIGVAGEPLAAGYFRNREETARRFTDFTAADGKTFRLYKTGDLAQWNAAGELLYRGRADFQIKHMGHRIELGEIERALDALPGVEQACCLFDREKNRLLGFYTGSALPPELRRGLKERLPDYMIPNRLTRLERFPLNKNGKIDRQALRDLGGKKS